VSKLAVRQGLARQLPPSLLCAAALGALWAILMPRTADLAAQVYRVQLFARNGFAVWDNAWFAGHQLLDYSLVSPGAGALLGLRPAGLLAVVVSVLCAEDLVSRLRPGSGPWPAVWFAIAAAGDLFIGRLTFALGTALAMVALVVLVRDRPLVAAVLSAAAAATSPVVGLLLLVVLGAALPRRVVWAPIATSAGTVAVFALLFSDGGSQPDDAANAALRVVIVIALWALLPHGERYLRRACSLYTLAMVATFVVPSPMGSNIARLGILAAGPVLLCAARRRTGRERATFVVVCAAIAAWQAWAPVSEWLKAHESPATKAAYFQPLLDALGRQGVANERVEVVPTSTRWESVYVAREYPMARGWESQLDHRYGALFYRDALSATAYRRWLDRVRVGYVAVSESTPERWGRTEQQLLRHPPAYLRLVWSDPNWRLFAVRDPRPIVTGATLVSMGAQEIRLRFSAPRTAHVAVHASSWWRASAGACVHEAGDFIRVTTTAPGLVRVDAQFPPRSPAGC
jgi:hypothetical protein